MRFQIDGAKLLIVGENSQEEEWISTLKISSRRVKAGSERFVIKAFNDWCHGKAPVNNTAFRLESLRKQAWDAAGNWRMSMRIDDPQMRRAAGSTLISAVNQYCSLKGVPVPWDSNDSRIEREEKAADFIDC